MKTPNIKHIQLQNVLYNLQSDNPSKLKKVRWAKNGRIDLENLNGIDYVLVPCRRKQQLLYVTNKYLKEFSETTSTLKLFGFDWGKKEIGDRLRLPYPTNIEEQNALKEQGIMTQSDMPINFDSKRYELRDQTIKYCWTFKSVLKKWNKWLIDESTIYDLDDNQLPVNLNAEWDNTNPLKNHKNSNKNSDLFIYTKQIVGQNTKLSKKSIEGLVNGLRLYSRESFNGVQQWFYGKQILDNAFEEGYIQPKVNDATISEQKSNVTLKSPLEAFQGQYVTKTPYMIFKNPFKGKVGGIIPVKDGKLLLEKARTANNLTLQLASTGENIQFDSEGICKTPLKPSHKMFWRPCSTGKKSFWKNTIKKIIIPKEEFEQKLALIEKWGGGINIVDITSIISEWNNTNIKLTQKRLTNIILGQCNKHIPIPNWFIFPFSDDSQIQVIEYLKNNDITFVYYNNNYYHYYKKTIKRKHPRIISRRGINYARFLRLNSQLRSISDTYLGEFNGYIPKKRTFNSLFLRVIQDSISNGRFLGRKLTYPRKNKFISIQMGYKDVFSQYCVNKYNLIGNFKLYIGPEFDWSDDNSDFTDFWSKKFGTLKYILKQV